MAVNEHLNAYRNTMSSRNTMFFLEPTEIEKSPITKHNPQQLYIAFAAPELSWDASRLLLNGLGLLHWLSYAQVASCGLHLDWFWLCRPTGLPACQPAYLPMAGAQKHEAKAYAQSLEAWGLEPWS